MTQRSAEIAYQVLRDFQQNSSYEDYRDGSEPFTDLEYWQLRQELYMLAFGPTNPLEGTPQCLSDGTSPCEDGRTSSLSPPDTQVGC